jgi:hypothetical protein
MAGGAARQAPSPAGAYYRILVTFHTMPEQQ